MFEAENVQPRHVYLLCGPVHCLIPLTCLYIRPCKHHTREVNDAKGSQDKYAALLHTLPLVTAQYTILLLAASLLLQSTHHHTPSCADCKRATFEVSITHANQVSQHM